MNWTGIPTCWSDPAATSTFTSPQCWPQQWREYCLSRMVLGGVIANKPCLELQLLQTWIFHGVQFNRHLRFVYLSFSFVKVHNIYNKIIQLNSTVKFLTTLAGGCCLPRLLNLLLLRKSFCRKICSFLNNSMDSQVTYQQLCFSRLKS